MTGRARVHALLQGLLADDEIVVAPEALRVAAADTFHEGPPPLALLRPRAGAALASVMPRLVEAGIAVVPRGAALSYTDGLAPGGGDWVSLDLRHLSRVLEIRDEDASVRVEAGCSWAALDAALAARGLQSPFRGPASGLHATVGGTLSQDAVFHGSARHGTAAEGVLGLVVLLPDGRRLRTGAALLDDAQAPAPFGPDLTRLFIGACGAFGVLLEATIRTVPRPAARRSAGYRCATRSIALEALRAAARDGDATEVLLVDPSVATRLAQRGADSPDVPGRAFAHDAPWLLGIAVDGVSDAAADARLAQVEAACVAAGACREGAGLLAPWLAEPFPPPRMLRGVDGRRWVPVHGLVPQSRAAAALDALDATMGKEHAAVSALDLRWSIACSAVGAGAVLVEANLTWPGPPNPVIEGYLGEAGSGPARDLPEPAHASLAQVARLRQRLAAALDAVGATHLQIGRTYAYRTRLDPVAAALLDGVKALFDPRGALNPGVLGLEPPPLRGDRR